MVLWGKSKDMGGKLQPNTGCAETVVKIDELMAPTPDNKQVVPTSDQLMTPKAAALSQEPV